MSNKLVDFLNNHLSDLNVLYVKLHNYHWNVEGSSFFTLHSALEEQYNGVSGQLDEVAERILQLGQRPYASMAEYVKHSNIKEVSSEGVKGKDLVKSVLEDYEYVISSLKKGIELADESSDKVTEDMFTGMLAGYEKSVWMLKAYLK